MVTLQEVGWLRSKNMSADAKGSIHDEERARALGFQAALIGGSVHSAFVARAARERFGPAWYERGFMKQTYRAPVYESTEFRIVMDELPPLACDEVLLELAFETREGVRATAGYFGLTKDAAAGVPPWERPGEPPAQAPAAGDRDPLPATPIGEQFPPFARVVTPEESAGRRAVAGDDSPWYTTASPWGGPIAPTFIYMLLGSGERRASAGAGAQDAAARAGMNGTWQLLQSGPMFTGRPYTVTAQLAEKGYSGRTAFRTNQFSVSDADGRCVATARQKVRWLLE